ncbi:hypothetical protein ABK040_006010 [Willaertia magna]
MLDLKNRYAVITGASFGIGEGIANQLGSLGCNLILLARNEGKLKEIQRALQEQNKGIKIHLIPTDFSKKESVDEAVIEIKSITNELYALINNAGTLPKKDCCLLQNLEDGTRLVETWEYTLNVNLLNLMRITNCLLPLLIPKAGSPPPKDIIPAIINIASVAGRKTEPDMASYTASKYGVVGFSHCLFEDVREHGVKVSCIEPGLTDTGMPFGKYEGLRQDKMIKVEDVVETVMFVLNSKTNCCPVEILIKPQRNPRLK